MKDIKQIQLRALPRAQIKMYTSLTEALLFDTLQHLLWQVAQGDDYHTWTM